MIITIKFEADIPDADLILRLMRKKTGLNICMKEGMFALELSVCEELDSLNFSWVEVEFKKEAKLIELTGLRTKHFYLLDVLINTLIEQGGIYEGEKLSYWAYKRWDEVIFKFFVPR